MNALPLQIPERCVNTKTTMHFNFKTIQKGSLFILGLFLSLLSTAVNAQDKKLSERYMDAYKKYSDAACPIKKDNIQHFVYFARDRELIKDHPFLLHSMFKGAQLMYSWRCKLPQKQYVLKVDRILNFKNVKHEKESIQSHTDCQYPQGV